MLIVITKDPAIVNARQQQHTGEPAWGPVHVLNPAYTQGQATTRLIALLAAVAANEPLCIVGHGNDTQAGGEGVGTDTWTWEAEEMAFLLNTELTAKPGPILLEVCSDDPTKVDKMQVIGFGTEVQRHFRTMQKSANLSGVTIYSYNNHIKKLHTLPDPHTIGNSVEVQGSML